MKNSRLLLWVMATVITFSLSPLTASAQTSVRYEVSHVGENINTVGSETGGVLVDDSVLLYTTMQSQETSRLYLIDFNPILTQVFQAPVAADGSLGNGTLNQWGLNANGLNCANVAYDSRNDILYFTRSESATEQVNHIYYSKRVRKRWSKALPMGGDVNLKGYTSTHPSVGYLPDGKVILYFSSDRPGGVGGMDLWYAILISEGLPGNCTNLGAPINTDSNEITPFYCNEEGVLYYSSNREGGQGGFDIYQTEGQRNSWRQPQSLGQEVNTTYDDLFFTVQPCRCRCVQQDSGAADVVEACGFLSSNRPGSLYKTDEGCCNDLFRWRRFRGLTPQPVEPAPVTATTQNQQRPTDLLPLSLYFHNDEPSPHTLDTTTVLDYAATYHRYMQMRDEYKGAQPSPVDKRKWDSIQGAVDLFFDHEVRRGYNDMLTFLQLLYDDLRQGHRVSITVDGFASPLFESLYNVNLSKRRIDSFRNQLLRWNSQVLKPYLDNGSLLLEQAAHGAADTTQVAPTDPLRNPRNQRSVYSLEAAHARRIDIVGYRFF